MQDCVAVFDIGSNAVRLVIYDAADRSPVKIHNERSLCRLGKGVAATGRLNPAGIPAAMEALTRFTMLAKKMGVRRHHAVATAAIRLAKDGAAFLAQVKKECGLDVRIIDGGEEARLSALGVMAGAAPGPFNGLIGDYGGGSLELLMIKDGRIRKKTSLPIGSGTLQDMTRPKRQETIETYLNDVPFLEDCKNMDLYALGGAWRAMAKAHMHMKNHPLSVVDRYTISGRQASSFAQLIARQSPKSLERAAKLSKGRIQDMSVAGIAMERLLHRIKPAHVVFSGTGLREGILFDTLTPAQKKKDGLLATAHKYALQGSRFAKTTPLEKLAAWVLPLMNKDTPSRLITASCLLSDICCTVHEDYQAEEAFRRIFIMPLYGISHEDRAFLALSQYVRHRGYLRRATRAKSADETTRPALALLDKSAADQAIILGLAQRLGYALSGGVPGLLTTSRWKVTLKKATLHLNAQSALLNTGMAKDTLDALGKAMDRTVSFAASQR